MFSRRALLPSLTPMIDVVFLLLLFFLLTTQLQNTKSVDLGLAGGGATEAERPLLIELGNELTLNGQAISSSEMVAFFEREEPKVLAVRVDESVDVGALVAFADQARQAGWRKIVLVGGRE